MLKFPRSRVTLWLIAPCISHFAAVSPLAARDYFGTKPSYNQSILIKNLRSGAVITSVNEEEDLIPASVSKIITAAAALEKFGSSYQIGTSFYHTGSRRAGKIEGTLFVEGGGDPLFTSEALWQIAADLRNLGIREITTGIAIDHSLFDKEFFDGSRETSQRGSTHAYDAPVSAFGFNFNTLCVSVASGDIPGQRARVSLDPYFISGVQIVNRTETVRAGSNAQLHVERGPGTKNGVQLVVSGSVPLSPKIHKIYRSIPDPTIFAGESIRAFLGDQGIQVRGEIREQKRPSDANFLMTYKGKTIGETIKALGLYSNNYIADMLTKGLGVYRDPFSKEPSQVGSFASGSAYLDAFLRQKVGLKSKVILKNGSGLSSDNRLSAKSLVEVLAFMHRRADLFPDFLTSLPIAGVTGTLKNRFKGDEISVRAKTGTLSEPFTVSSLAGYLHSTENGWLAFAIIQNGKEGEPQPSLADFHEIEEEGLRKILQGA